MTQTSVNHAQELVDRYRAFYRAEKKYNPATRDCIKPFKLAADILFNSDSTLRGEVLIQAISARLMKLMQQVHASGGAQGRWVLASPVAEREAITEFARYLVQEVFEVTFNGDLARLAGRQIGYLENSVEFVYRVDQDIEHQPPRIPRPSTLGRG